MNAQMQSAYESKALQLQRDYDNKLAQLQNQLDRAKNEARQAVTVQEREVRLAKLREEGARDDAAAATSAQKDAETTLNQTAAQQKSFALANERLKEKLAVEQAAREKEMQSKNAQLQQWGEELKEAQAAQKAAEKRAARSEALEQQVAQLQHSNDALQAQLQESKGSRDEFLYSVQVANERLKEKLRKSEEDKVALLAELEQKSRLEHELERSEARRQDAVHQLQEAKQEAERAVRYKDDWMAEVKRRVLLEERGNAEAGGLRLQLEQTQERLKNLTEKSGQSEQVAAIAAELTASRATVSTLQKKVQELEASMASATADAQKKQSQAAETQRKLSEALAENARLQSRLKDERIALEKKEADVARFADDLQRLQKRSEKTEESLREEIRKSASFQLASAQLEKELTVFKSTHSEDLHGKVQELLNTSGSMAHQLETSSSKQEQLMRQLQEANRDIAKLKTQIAEQEQEVSEISDTARSWKARCEKAEQSLKQEEEANRALIMNERSKAEALNELQKRLATIEGQAAHDRELREQRESQLDTLQAAANVDRVRSAGAIQELQERIAAAECRWQEAGSDRVAQTWSTALEAVARDDLPTVRKCLHAAEKFSSPLDNLIRSALQNVVHVAETGQRSAETVASPISAVVAAAVAKAVSPSQQHSEESTPQGVANMLKRVLEDKAGQEFEQFRVVQSAPQAHPFGKTLFLKVDIGRGEAVWIRVFQTSGSPPVVNSAQGPKDLSEDMVYFDEWDFNFDEDDDEDDDNEVHILHNVEEKEEDDAELDQEEEGDEEDVEIDGGGDQEEPIEIGDSEDEKKEKEGAEEEEEEHVDEPKEEEKEEEEQVTVKKSRTSRSKKKAVVREVATPNESSVSPSASGSKKRLPPIESHYSLRGKK